MNFMVAVPGVEAVSMTKDGKRYQSMHPGVQLVGNVPTRIHPLKVTSKPNKRTGKVFRFVTARFDRRSAAWEQTQRSVDAKQKAAFKRPGSRNPGKLRQR